MAQTAQQRRAAQRRLAKNLREHKPILPPEITKKAKAVAGKRKDLLNQIDAFKERKYSGRGKWDEKGSRASTRINGNTGKLWTVTELEEIWEGIQGTSQIQADNYDWTDVFEENEDYVNALHYH